MTRKCATVSPLSHCAAHQACSRSASGLAGPAVGSHNGHMVMLDAAFVFGLLGLVTYVVIRLLTASADGSPTTRTGHWRTAHHDAEGVTRVVLERVGPRAASVLDEHLIATIPIDDPDYDTKFLSAMAAARERQALFEAEEG
jgi:hypothetical protein